MVELNQQIHWVPGARHGRPVRQLARERARLVDQPQPLLGHADPGLEERRPDATRASTSTARSPSSSATSACRPTDLHRPDIDRARAPEPRRSERQERRCAASPDVLDCWFESGSMPYAQVHYPFENREWFEHHFPADFIVEYVAQTRGWFYTLIVLSTALFDRPPFQTCICHGVVARRGRPEAQQAAAQLPRARGGVRHARRRRAALVPGLVAGPARRRPARRQGRQGDRRGGAAACCCRSGTPGTSSRSTRTPTAYAREPTHDRRRAVLDRYVLAKTRELVASVGERMDAYDIAGACQTRARRSSRRSTTGTSAAAARASGRASATPTSRPPTTRSCTALVTLCRVASPLLPFLTDEIHRGLTGGESVHLTRLAGRARRCPPTPSWCATWTACATSAPPRSACAGSRTCACGSRWRELDRGRPRRAAPRALPRARARRGQREGGGAVGGDRGLRELPGSS